MSIIMLKTLTVIIMLKTLTEIARYRWLPPFYGTVFLCQLDRKHQSTLLNALLKHIYVKRLLVRLFIYLFFIFIIFIFFNIVMLIL